MRLPTLLRCPYALQPCTDSTRLRSLRRRSTSISYQGVKFRRSKPKAVEIGRLFGGLCIARIVGRGARQKQGGYGNLEDDVQVNGPLGPGTEEYRRCKTDKCVSRTQFMVSGKTVQLVMVLESNHSIKPFGRS